MGDPNTEKIVERSPDERYSRFNHELGHGASKAVYKAYDEDEGIEVAWCQVNVGVYGEVTRKQIHQEVEILKGLDHPHILKFHAIFDQPALHQIVFITEIMTSGTLKHYTNKAKRVRRKLVKKWCRQILEGLSYLHGNRIIHRDLKCDNIFINGANSEVKIGDLGLSTLIREGSQPQSVLGTPEFMAPELYDELYDEKVDVYAFGMCVLEMVTGEYPYSECLNAAQIYKKVTANTKPASLEKILDTDTKKFIELCLMHDHRQRPTSKVSCAALWHRAVLAPQTGRAAHRGELLPTSGSQPRCFLVPCRQELLGNDYLQSGIESPDDNKPVELKSSNADVTPAPPAASGSAPPEPTPGQGTLPAQETAVPVSAASEPTASTP